jgi:hypothetical protein
LVAPDELGGTAVLPQFLAIKNKEIDAQAHKGKLSDVIAALREEVSPPIGEPLNAETVAELAARRALGRPAAAYAVACLFAALGRSSDARHWIGEYHSAVEALKLPEQPIDVFRSSFLSKVGEWIAKQSCIDELLKVAEQEKAKLLAEA